MLTERKFKGELAIEFKRKYHFLKEFPLPKGKGNPPYKFHLLLSYCWVAYINTFARDTQLLSVYEPTVS